MEEGSTLLLCAILLALTFVAWLNFRGIREGLKGQHKAAADRAVIMERQKIIMTSNEQLTNEIADLNSALDVISTGLGNLVVTLAVASQRISELEAAGVSGEVLTSLTGAVDRAQEIAAALVPAVDPGQTTPPAEEIPAPPEDAPAEVPAVPSPETPEVPVTPAEEVTVEPLPESDTAVVVEEGSAADPSSTTEESSSE